MSRPTYYFWRNDFSSQEEFETAKDKYKKLGFRVVTYSEGQKNTNIHDGLKALIKNHYINYNS